MFSQLGPFTTIGQQIMSGNPERCALVNSITNIVENIIIADPAVDPAPDGYVIIGLPANSAVSSGWIYDPATGQFTDPNAPQGE